MAKYVCDICNWEYDEAAGLPDQGIAPGTKWEELPEISSVLCAVHRRKCSHSCKSNGIKKDSHPQYPAWILEDLSFFLH